MCIAQVNNAPLFSLQPEALCEIEQVTSARVSREDELSCRVELSLKDPDKEVSTTSFLYCFLVIDSYYWTF